MSPAFVLCSLTVLSGLDLNMGVHLHFFALLEMCKQRAPVGIHSAPAWILMTRLSCSAFLFF